MNYVQIQGETDAVLWRDEESGDSGVMRTTDEGWTAYLSWLAAGNSLASPSAGAMQSLDDVKAMQIAVVNQSCQQALAAITAAYPDLEIATWPQQLADAQAYTGDENSPAPMLTAIAASSGLTVADIAAGVLAKAHAYQQASGEIIGRRIALTALIDEAEDADAVRAITW